MFKELRNRLILINLSITTIVLVLAFSAIYFITTHSANNRSVYDSKDTVLYNDNMNQMLRISLEAEKQAAARELLTLLVISGIAIDLIVALISYYLAEEAIKPVKKAYDVQKIFIANASHEIKTPLAAISANLEALDMNNNRWIKNIVIETDKLTALNKQLLDLAKSDLTPNAQIQEVNLKDTVDDVLQRFEPRLTNTNLKVKYSLNNPVKLNITDFLQILTILLDNAIKYSKNQIRVEVTEQSVSVMNDGATIEPEDMEHIFERFYQTNKSAEGVGLGLAIAKSLADRNNWQIKATSDAKSTKFVLKFGKI